MYGISGEHILVLLVILLIFGPRRLPDLGHSIGRTIKNFKDGMSGGSGHPEASRAPTQAPVVAAQIAPKVAATEPVPEEIKEEEKV